MQMGYAHSHGILTAYILFQRPSWRKKNYLGQDTERSMSLKGKYKGHKVQRSMSLCNFISQEGTISTINDLTVLNWGMGQMVREKHQIIVKVL